MQLPGYDHNMMSYRWSAILQNYVLFIVHEQIYSSLHRASHKASNLSQSVQQEETTNPAPN